MWRDGKRFVVCRINFATKPSEYKSMQWAERREARGHAEDYQR